MILEKFDLVGRNAVEGYRRRGARLLLATRRIGKGLERIGVGRFRTNRLEVSKDSFVVSEEDSSVLKRDERDARIDTKAVGPPHALGGVMKVAAKQNHRALDYFTSTIIPCHRLQAVAVLTFKHAVLLVGFGVGMMALVRLILAD